MGRLVQLSDDSTVPAVDTDRLMLVVGDAVRGLSLLGSCSVDTVVTDPPCGLQFNDQDWDGARGFRESLDFDASGLSDGQVFEAWCRARAAEPGGHMSAFGGTRTWHRLMAGFEVRDQIAWLYSTGMPKSMDISNAIDQHLGAVRKDREVEVSNSDGVLGMTRRVLTKGDPITDEARRMAGWGTGLKPGFDADHGVGDGLRHDQGGHRFGMSLRARRVTHSPFADRS
jgi:site-specific DNA-methyltransferase (adenine-specific)